MSRMIAIPNTNKSVANELGVNHYTVEKWTRKYNIGTVKNGLRTLSDEEVAKVALIADMRSRNANSAEILAALEQLSKEQEALKSGRSNSASAATRGLKAVLDKVFSILKK